MTRVGLAARLDAAERALVQARFADFAAEAEAAEAEAIEDAAAGAGREARDLGPRLERLATTLGHVAGVAAGLRALREGEAGGYGPDGAASSRPASNLRAEA